jgi:hypothetical protein
MVQIQIRLFDLPSDKSRVEIDVLKRKDAQPGEINAANDIEALILSIFAPDESKVVRPSQENPNPELGNTL